MARRADRQDDGMAKPYHDRNPNGSSCCVDSFFCVTRTIVSGRDPARHGMAHGCATAPDFHGDSPEAPDNNFFVICNHKRYFINIYPKNDDFKQIQPKRLCFEYYRPMSGTESSENRVFLKNNE